MKIVRFILLFATFMVFDITCTRGEDLRMAKGGEFKNVVSFRSRQAIRLFDKHLCMGGLITNEWILTTYSCVENYRTDTSKIIAYAGGRFFWSGRLSLFGPGQHRDIEKILEVEDKNGKSVNAGIVKVTESFDTQASVVIPPRNFQKSTITPYRMPSWGRLKTVVILYVLGFIPDFHLASPWLRVYTLSRDTTQTTGMELKLIIQGNETPCPEDLGAPLFSGEAFVGVYLGGGSCDKPKQNEVAQFLLLHDLEHFIRKEIPDLFNGKQDITL